MDEKPKLSQKLPQKETLPGKSIRQYGYKLRQPLK